MQLDELARRIEERAGSGDPASYTAKLALAGKALCARKLGEEAVETVVAALSGDRKAVASEAADLLYHLLVLLHVCEVPLSDVMKELDGRTARTGLEEKAARSG